MSKAFTSAGTLISISDGIPLLYNRKNLRELSWYEIGEVVDITEFGRDYVDVTHNSIKERRTVKKKGSRNEGSFIITLAKKMSDLGQSILKVGLNETRQYPFRVVLPDTTIQYFPGLITSMRDNYSDADSMASSTFSIDINKDILLKVFISESGWYNYYFEIPVF